MEKRITYGFILLVLLLLGCNEEPIDWKFDSKDLNRVVVDGIITNELKAQLIQLSHTNSQINEGLQPLIGASVWVDDNTLVYEFAESASEPGNYYSTPFQAVIDNIYYLTLIHEADTFEAYADMVPVTAQNPTYIQYDTSSYLYHFVYTGSRNPAMTKVYYNWSANPDYCEQYGNCYAQETFYNLDNIDVNALFKPETEAIEFPLETIILRKKYSLTEAHQKFLRSLLMETEWSGGIFDVQHGNVSSNMSNGALGFFAACMVVVDTVVVN